MNDYDVQIELQKERFLWRALDSRKKMISFQHSILCVFFIRKKTFTDEHVIVYIKQKIK